MQKRCSICGEQKPISAFGADRRAATGLQASCKDCANARRRELRSKNPERYRKRERARYKANPETRLSNNRKWRAENSEAVRLGKAAYYETIKDTADYQERSLRYRDENRKAKREYDREYSRKNSERIVRRVTNWSKANPERRRAITFAYDSKRRAQCAEGASGPEVKAWADRQPKTCRWCGTDCAEDYHIDHVVPLSKGGAHRLGNLAIACPPCNLRKNAKLPEEFEAELGAKAPR